MPHHSAPHEYRSAEPATRVRPRRFIAHACIAAVFCLALISLEWQARLWSHRVTDVHMLLSLYGLSMVIGCVWSGGLSRHDRVIVAVSAVISILSALWCFIWPIIEPAY